MTQFSVVIPTLNESENIDLLLTRLFALKLSPNSFEVIFVDDGSTDETPDKIRAWRKQSNIKLVERTGNPDLTASILAGAAVANSEVIVVMDADLSHPPESLPAVVKPVLDNNQDISIGSRYVRGGRIDNWPWYREWLSRAGSWIARPISDVNDATSGFFAFRKILIQSLP
ncbi:MAG: glycosyltransferase, partial [Nitrosomonas sp.]|nr:glycosyltransferase [Nitrosomonas sp.]